MLVPKKQGGNKNKLPEWIDKRKIKKEAKKKDSLSTKTKNLISKYAKTSVKQIPYSYVCSGCNSSFNADLLQKQIIESARRGDSYISCPKCGKFLVVDRLVKVSTKQNSAINRNVNLIAVYPNQGITPAYTPQSWVDRALLEKICHELGKYCQKFGFFNPQLKFQRGVVRGSVEGSSVENIKFAEYIISAVDNLDLRFRVLATAGITPAGKVVLPETFSTLDGREIPFTKEAVADFLSGKLFAVTEPKVSAPEIHFKERDFTRFREVVASKKTAGAYYIEFTDFETRKDAEKILDEHGAPVLMTAENRIYFEQEEPEVVKILEGAGMHGIVMYHVASKKSALDKEYSLSALRDLLSNLEAGEYSVVDVLDEVQSRYGENSDLYRELTEVEVPAQAVEILKEYINDMDWYIESKRKGKTAAGIPTPGQQIEYQGKIYTVDSVTGDASVLTDETGVKTVPIPNTDLNIQATPGVVTTPGAVPPIPTTTLAEKVKNLIKRSLRDEKTLVPFTESEPDYSVAKQTDVDADFSVPYEKSNQGILPEEERAIQKMFRGGASIKPVKTSNEIEASLHKKGDRYKIASLQKFAVSCPDCGLEMGDPRTESCSEKHINIMGKDYLRDTSYFDVNERCHDCNIVNIGCGHADKDTYVFASINKIKKTAEPTGYHETDETGKQIPISRLRTLINDYVRAGQFPPDFDLTKVMSEVSRMTRKELEEILDKKLKNQHYPVVHASKKTAFDIGERVQLVTDVDSVPAGTKAKITRLLTPEQREIAKADYEVETPTGYRVNVTNEEIRYAKKKTAQELLKGDRVKHYKHGLGYIDYIDNTTYSIPIYVIKLDEGDEIAVPRGEIEKVTSKKLAEKYISEGDRVRTLGGLSGIVSEIMPSYQFRSGITGTGYSVVLDDGRINVFSLADLEKTAKRKISQGKLSSEIIQKVKANLTEKNIEEDIKDETEGEKKYDQMAKEVECPKAEKALKDMADDEAEHAEKLEEIVLPAIEEQEEEEEEKKEASLRFAQEEETEEKPKVEFKTLKTKPHQKELDVGEAVVATPEMQQVFHEIKDHKQRLDEIKAIVTAARQKVEEEIRKVQEEHGSVEEAEEMSQAIEKLASLLEESNKKIIDLGEFFAYLDTSIKTKKFNPDDKWRVEKLLEKFGEEAKNYLEKAERGAASLDKEVKQRLLTVFPKREGSIEKEANVFDSIKSIGVGLWSYIKEISSILSEGEQLDLGLVE